MLKHLITVSVFWLVQRIDQYDCNIYNNDDIKIWLNIIQSVLPGFIYTVTFAEVNTYSGHSCTNSMIAQDKTADAVQRSHSRENVLEHADYNMSIKSSHKDPEGTCISLDQVLSWLSLQYYIQFMSCVAGTFSIVRYVSSLKRIVCG